MKDLIQTIQEEFDAALANAQTREDVEQLRIDFIGRKSGKLNDVFRGLKDLGPVEKREVGPMANATKKHIEEALTQAEKQFAQTASAEDITLPSIPPRTGHPHPLTKMEDELIHIFRTMGFMVQEGVELDHDYYNFESLNFPQGHSARDMHDTFFVKSDVTRKEKHGFKPKSNWLLRTHTSNMQVRVMEEHEPPIRCVIPGRAYRNEATDASHEFVLYQFEGFVVDENITIGHLKWFLKEMFHQLYGAEVDIRLRPGYFPFVEPGYEVDMSCVFCSGSGCKTCKKTGWLEMLGSGMIHPNVLKAAGINPQKYSGFAFGVGTMRLAMMKYGIPDIRMLMESDIRFIEQFSL